MFKSFKRNLIGIFVLMVGVVIGLFLIQQSQEYREKAKEIEKRQITVCHKTDPEKDIWEEIEVDEDELKDYLDKGDIIGDCPEKTD